MFCSNCGKDIKEGSKFCKNCGKFVLSTEVKDEENIRKKKSKKSLILGGIIVIVIFFIAIIIFINNYYKSLDPSTINFLDALERNDYNDAEEFIRLGADVDFVIAGRHILHNAVHNNNIDEVNFLINHGADLNSKTTYGRTPLHEAALYGRYDIAKILIEAGTNINARNSRGETPLFYAEVGLIIGPSHTNMNDKVAELLRSYGAIR